MKKKNYKANVPKEIIVGNVPGGLNQLYMLSFFSGIRGLDIGGRKAGFSPLFLSDWWLSAGKAFEANIPSPDNPDQPEYLKSEGLYVCGEDKGDIKKISFRKIQDYILEHLKIKVERGEITVIHGGPPCQDVSISNNFRCVSTEQNRLIFELLRIIEEAHPKVGLIEQVPYLIGEKFAELWHEIQLVLNSMTDYVWDYKVMNAMNHGARQNRKRLIIMLVRRDLNVPVSFPKAIEPALEKVAVQKLLPEVYHFSPGQYKDDIKSAKNNVFCTMTCTGSEWLYGIDGKRRKPTINERIVLSELEGLKLKGISVTDQKTLIGNMVQISFAEALFRHIKSNILKVNS
jgi:site-specific DNA-cytosine methylase